MKNPKVTSTFVLKDPKAKKSLIYLVARIQGQNRRLKFSTGETINPKHWSYKERRAKLSAAKGDGFLKDELIILNQRLTDYEQTFRRAYLELQENNTPPTVEYFREALVRKFGGKTKGRIIYLTDFADDYLKIANIRTTTKRAYGVALACFKEYEAYTKSRIIFDSFSIPQFDRLVLWMQDEKKLAKNTIGIRIKNLKYLFNKAYEYGHHKNEVYKKFKTVNEDSINIALTEDELQKLWDLDLSQNKRLEAMRDIFIVGCRTALRYEDWGHITPEMVDFKAKKICITTTKTLQSVVVPLHWQVAEILKKHGNRLPRVPSNQKCNMYIKELCEVAGIDSPVFRVRTVGNEIKRVQYKKHELTTTHTARRTAATLMYMAGIDSLAIRKITGHNDERSFLKYIKVSEDENAERLLQHDFYKSPLRVAK